MKQTYRSKTGFVLAWAWLAFVAFNAVDLTVRYSGKSSLVAGAVLAVLTAVVYVVALRPATVVGEHALVVRNPFRTTTLPWPSIEEVNVTHSINVEHDGGQVLRAWTPTSTARERAKAQGRGGSRPSRGRFRTEPSLNKAEQAAAEAFAGKTHADWVGDQISDKAETAKRRGEEAAPVTTTWAIDAFAIFGVALLMVIAAIVVS
ncbi:PH domain-containing protein [Nonomuraea sp. NBC_01738]|uniref:PH domain-containing protein n=1 Tax=Nonomuraea sp. NBC_01738 TaxID=2976003 RepID=UPI002E11F7EE|nr:PH domain-containing protein [Nonomuraea sp. NBC_01738]